jgi:hypothetical protein
MILKKIFAKKLAKKLAFLTQNNVIFLNLIITFEKNVNFFAENCQKSQKIVIITSTPGHSVLDSSNQIDEGRNRGCQIVLGTTYQNGKNIPNVHNIFQKYVK